MEQDFSRYEYVNVTIVKDLAAVCGESYHSFGWQVLEEKKNAEGVTIRMKRSKNICDRSKLMIQQRKMEDVLIEMESYEKKRIIIPTMWAIVTGLIGCGFVAIAVYSLTVGRMLAFLLNQVVGVVLCAMALLVYNRTSDRHRDDYVTEINHLYEQLYDACSAGERLCGKGAEG